MTLFKACQRCGGDLRASGDIYGDYLQCVQCGHLIDLPGDLGFLTAAEAAEREKAAA